MPPPGMFDYTQSGGTNPYNPQPIGGPIDTSGYVPDLGPYRSRAAAAPEVYNIASDMLAPLFGAGGMGGMGGGGFTQTASALDQIGGQANPGMSDDEYNQALRAITQSSRARRAEMANQMGGGASGMDPSVYYRATQGLQAGQDAAIGQLGAQRAALNRQTLMGATSALAPYYSTQQQGLQNYQNQLGSVAGEIMGGMNMTPGNGSYVPIEIERGSGGFGRY